MLLHGLVRSIDHSNDEVEHDHQVEEALGVPCKPNHVDVDLVGKSGLTELVVHGHTQLANRGPEGLQQGLLEEGNVFGIFHLTIDIVVQYDKFKGEEHQGKDEDHNEGHQGLETREDHSDYETHFLNLPNEVQELQESKQYDDEP